MRIAEFGLVDVLAAGALRAHGIDPQIVVLDVDIDVLDLRQHRHRRRRSVNAPLRLGVGHALHPVHAGLEFQLGERAAALHFGNDFLVAAHGAFAGGDHFDLPALQGGKALIHPEQVAGEQRGLVAAGAGADFQHDVAVVHGILGQQRDADLLRQLGAAFHQPLALGLGHAAHLGVRGGVRYQRIDAGQFGIGGAVGFDGVDQRIEFGKLAGELDVIFRLIWLSSWDSSEA